MKIIVGLGNPGREYAHTRHNVGFITIDELSNRHNISLDKEKFKGIYGSGFIQGEKVILVKPLTYMNLSGECVRPMMDYFGLDVENLIVIYDDLDLPIGKIRLRTKGSAGGQNGMKSIIQQVGSQDFKRIRIGIGRPTNGMSVPNYVLSKFTEEEVPDVVASIKSSADACDKWMKDSFIDVMNQFNSKN
jgi:peptidyl-tRNA hydrolase, PTH1 family